MLRFIGWLLLGTLCLVPVCAAAGHGNQQPKSKRFRTKYPEIQAAVLKGLSRPKQRPWRELMQHVESASSIDLSQIAEFGGKLRVSRHMDEAGRKQLWIAGERYESSEDATSQHYRCVRLGVVEGSRGSYCNYAPSMKELPLPRSNAASVEQRGGYRSYSTVTRKGKRRHWYLEQPGLLVTEIEGGRHRRYLFYSPEPNGGEGSGDRQLNKMRWKPIQTIEESEQLFDQRHVSGAIYIAGFRLHGVSRNGQYAVFSRSNETPAHEYYGVPYTKDYRIYSVESGQLVAKATNKDITIVNRVPPGHPGYRDGSIDRTSDLSLDAGKVLGKEAEAELTRIWKKEFTTTHPAPWEFVLP
jgi:hypothetical protein